MYQKDQLQLFFPNRWSLSHDEEQNLHQSFANLGCGFLCPQNQYEACNDDIECDVRLNLFGFSFGHEVHVIGIGRSLATLFIPTHLIFL